jgi:MraZ protein
VEQFFGEFECKVDQKGRMILPARLKNQLPENEQMLWITRGFEPCLTVYTVSQWQPIYQKISQLNAFNKKERAFQRYFLGGTTEAELDKAGRFLIPKLQLRYAQLEDEVLIVGMGSRFEIWNPETYQQKLLKDTDTFSEMAENFFGSMGEDSSDSGSLVFNINRSNDKNTLGSGG